MLGDKMSPMVKTEHILIRTEVSLTQACVAEVIMYDNNFATPLDGCVHIIHLPLTTWRNPLTT